MVIDVDGSRLTNLTPNAGTDELDPRSFMIRPSGRGPGLRRPLPHL
jgi:hypothetical protein